MPELTIKVTAAALTKIDRLVATTDLQSREAVLQSGLTLLGIHVEAARRNVTIGTVGDGQFERNYRRIRLPFDVEK
jgi:hypothetical protein